MADNQNIFCTVNSCHYWQKGNRCSANEILVSSERSDAGSNITSATMSTMSETPVGSGMETCCKTYVRRGSDDSSLDSVYRHS